MKPIRCQRHEYRDCVPQWHFQAEGTLAELKNSLWLSSWRWLRSVEHYSSQLSLPEGSDEIVSCCCIVGDSDGDVPWGRRRTNIFIMRLKPNKLNIPMQISPCKWSNMKNTWKHWKAHFQNYHHCLLSETLTSDSEHKLFFNLLYCGQESTRKEGFFLHKGQFILTSFFFFNQGFPHWGGTVVQ